MNSEFDKHAHEVGKTSKGVAFFLWQRDFDKTTSNLLECYEPPSILFGDGGLEHNAVDAGWRWLRVVACTFFLSPTSASSSAAQSMLTPCDQRKS